MLTPVADGVVVHDRAGALVVDPGITATELACLGDDLRASRQVVVAGSATHPDWDHMLWDTALGDGARRSGDGRAG